VATGYDAAGRQTTRTDARGNRTTYGYDAAGRPTSRRYPNGTRVTMVYNAAGERTALVDPTGRTTYTVDGAGRVAGVTYPTLRRLTYAYDAHGRRSRLVNPDGGLFTYAYDLADRMTALVNPQGNRSTFAYDGAGRRTVKRLANGTRTSTTFDNAGRVLSVYNLKADGSVVSSFRYTNDPVGNRTAVIQATGDTLAWGYDAAYQLSYERRTGANAYATTFTYDAAGNRVRKQDGTGTTLYTYDAADRMLTERATGVSITYTYDVDGNQTSVLNGTQQTTNRWDFENRNVGTTLPSGETVTFTYDGDLRMIDRADSLGVARRYVWDGENLLNESDELGLTKAEYTYQPAVFGDLISQRQGAVSQFYHFDALGSTDSLTDASAVITDSYAYKAYGETAFSTGTSTNPYQFVGEKGYYLDRDLGVHLVRARQYRASAGRFLS
jgi:YD repeat-containing protein